MNEFNIDKINFTKYLFFTGKGGVGKTSLACSIALNLSLKNKKILLISTDPASNLNDVFNIEVKNEITTLKLYKNLDILNIDPTKEAEIYKKSVLEPFIGKLPEHAIKNMEEQLSGSCTIEIAAFNTFTKYLSSNVITNKYDHIIFDTAPTGHTLRMLELPAAWNDFIGKSNGNASCLGQLSGLKDKKKIYEQAVDMLRNPNETTMFLVSRPNKLPLIEVSNASNELSELGIFNKILLINGILFNYTDDFSKKYYESQQIALKNMPNNLLSLKMYMIPMRSYNIAGVDNIKNLLTNDTDVLNTNNLILNDVKTDIGLLVDELLIKNRKIIFLMGKGGVGKTTLAYDIAYKLSQRGKDVRLTTTDPANHLKYFDINNKIKISFIDQEKELEKYKESVINNAKDNVSKEELNYIIEDLNSPCTKEIAVFKAFANIVYQSTKDEIVVIDTAPTGHTLLLLESTFNYQREIQRTNHHVEKPIKELLPLLKSEKTEVIIVTLAETTPYFEARRLENDLKRAKININYYIVNASLYSINTNNKILNNRKNQELNIIEKLQKDTNNNLIVLNWDENRFK